MTPREHEILSIIEGAIARTGCPPTYREMAQALGVRSLSSINQTVKSLVRQGRLRHSPRTFRGLELIDLRPAALHTFPDDVLLAELRRRGVAIGVGQDKAA